MQSLVFTRRQALATLAATPLRASLPGAVSKAMFLSLNSTLTSGRVPWPDFARLAARVGFAGVDVMLKPAMAAGAAATRDLLAELGVLPAALELPVEFRKDETTFGDALRPLDAACAFAAAIGCPRMVTYIMPSSDTPKAELRARYQARFTAIARVMEPHGVRLGLEFLGPLHFRKAARYEFIWRMNEMLELARECGPNVGLLLDAWHWHHAGASTEDIRHAGRERIVHVHFDDAPRLPPEQIRDNERLMPGEGVIDLTGFLRALASIGYKDALSVEVFGRGLKEMTPEQGAALGLRTAEAVFRKAAVPLAQGLSRQG